MLKFSHDIAGGQGNLIATSLQSPNFNTANPAASPSPSWGVLKNGLAYFFGLVLSGGTIIGPDYIFNTAGLFFYNGTPAAGNMVGSLTAAGGTDQFGNRYLPGSASYNGPGAIVIWFTGITSYFGNLSSGWTSAAVLNFNNVGGVATFSGPLTVTGKITSTGGAPNSPTVITTDTWTAATPPAGFTGTLRYRMTNDGQVDVQCLLTVANTVAAGAVTLITLPTAYIPATTARGPVGYFTNAQTTVAQVLGLLNMRWSANPAGTFTIQAFAGGAAGTGVTELDFTARYPLT